MSYLFALIVLFLFKCHMLTDYFSYLIPMVSCVTGLGLEPFASSWAFYLECEESVFSFNTIMFFLFTLCASFYLFIFILFKLYLIRLFVKKKWYLMRSCLYIVQWPICFSLDTLFTYLYGLFVLNGHLLSMIDT